MTSKLWATWPSLCTSTLNISIAERLEARHWKIRNQYSAKEDYHWDWINKLNNDYLLILTHIIEFFSTQNQTPTTWKLIPREYKKKRVYFSLFAYSIFYNLFHVCHLESVLIALLAICWTQDNCLGSVAWRIVLLVLLFGINSVGNKSFWICPVTMV